jgi:dienelactone hydrolase
VESELALIVLTGSDGMFTAARKIAKQFADNGISSIAVAYFNTSETSKDLVEIPVEIIEHSADWLRGRGFKKVAVYGISKGAEYALLAASYISQLNAVIAVSPSCCVFEGLTKNKRPAAKSSWSWKGIPIPYISFGGYIPHFLGILRKNKEIRFVDEYNSLLDTEMNESNTIKVENISGPILLLSAHEDVMWPSERMGNLIVNRLRDKRVKFQYRHEVYPYASHLLCPISTPWSRIFKMERSYRKECNTARDNAFKLSLDFLHSI